MKIKIEVGWVISLNFLIIQKKRTRFGWSPKMNSEQAINLAIEEIIKDHNHKII